MTKVSPKTKAMSRAGKGTAAETGARDSTPIEWREAEDRLTKGGWFWLATVRPGKARRVRDEAMLARASHAFKGIYDWPAVVAGDELDAEYGAPTSGGPPDAVYEIRPTVAFGLPTDGESFTPTRWRFER